MPKRRPKQRISKPKPKPLTRVQVEALRLEVAKGANINDAMAKHGVTIEQLLAHAGTIKRVMKKK
ncbi:MAG: hypothetical protein JXB14_06790 [Candidatus Altiarchaeota archaeon]|nr:hypothetical protein [Candidatus Altiarchaeota archaeon]